MKKTVVLLLLLLIFTSVCPISAYEFNNPAVTDKAEYLTKEELNQLNLMAEEVRQKYDFDVAVFTESEMSGYSAMQSADDIYDYNGYGGSNYDGVLLYICTNPREYWISTYAEGMDVFNEAGMEYVTDEVVSYLSADDYYRAIESFIDVSDELLELRENGEYYGEVTDGEYMLAVILMCFIVPVIIAFIMMAFKLSQMKTAVRDDYAGNYIKNGSVNLTVSRDMFLYSRITKKPKPKSNSSSGHMSSSGRTHSGSGGRY